jgi:DNA-binding NarL/FixJ family response regulator
VLTGIDDVTLVGEADSQEEIGAALRSARPDVLVIDDRLLPAEGHLLAGAGPLPSTVRVIVMGMDDHPTFAARARHAGAEAWIAKDMADEALPALLRAGAR